MKKILKLSVLPILVLMLTASCAKTPNPQESAETPVSPQQTETPEASVPPHTAITADREGNPITLPETINSVMSIGPSTTEILIDLGLGEKIISADDYSAGIDGLPAGIPLFNMTAPDGEQIISLNPDIVFVTSMTKSAGGDLFKPVSDAGICVIYIPSGESIAEIIEDIRFIASVMGEKAKGDDIISEMESKIEQFRKTAESITEKKTVYFEIEAAPYMYSFGRSTYLNELIEIVGAVNIIDSDVSWLSVTDEVILERNPDVILSSVSYIDDVTAEIISRPGWDSITAVQNSDVYKIDADVSSRPNHGIIKALNEMGAAIYPDIYK